MALHLSKSEMQKEALKELIEVAEYCINFDKSSDPRWNGYTGCYGYPSALILLSIVDNIGSIIKGGGNDTKTHFQILNDPSYYNLSLSNDQVETLRNGYRNKLTHNSYMEIGIGLRIGFGELEILSQREDGKYWLNLSPLLNISKKVVKKIIEET